MNLSARVGLTTVLIFLSGVSIRAAEALVTIPIPNQYIISVKPGTDVQVLATTVASNFGGKIRRVWPALHAFDLRFPTAWHHRSKQSLGSIM